MRRGIAALTLLLCSCGGGPESDVPSRTASTEAPNPQIIVKNIAFNPQTLTVEAGTLVAWRNDDKDVRHTVTTGRPGDKGVPGVRGPRPNKLTGLFDANLADAGATFTFTFARPGSYGYFCRVHPSMTAVVVVE